jgi:hypothetical protein
LKTVNLAGQRSCCVGFSSTHGAPTRTVFQSIDDPNDITVEHIFKNLADARTLVSSTDLAQAMTDAGVLGTPQLWLVEKR